MRRFLLCAAVATTLLALLFFGMALSDEIAWRSADAELRDIWVNGDDDIRPLPLPGAAYGSIFALLGGMCWWLFARARMRGTKRTPTRG